jgi:hypothetical protein
MVSVVATGEAGNGIVQAMSTTNLSYGGGSYFHLYSTIACHEIDAIEKLYLDNREVTFGASPDPRWAVGTFEGRVFHAAVLGAEDQWAQPDMLSQLPTKWTTDHRQKGHAGEYGILIFDQNTFIEGFPEREYLVRGKKCYDPRTTLTVWTQNAALIIADYMTNTKYGMGIDWADIDTTALTDSANNCDEDVSLPAGGTEKRYTIDGLFNTGMTHRQVLEEMILAMAGHIVHQGGKWYIYSGKWRAPSFTITEDDFRGAIRISLKTSRRDSYNSVKGTYINPSDDYQEAEYPRVKNDTYITADGENTLDLNLNLVHSHTRCQRIGRIMINRVGQPIEFSAPMSARLMAYIVCDTGYVNFAKYGWVNKLFEIKNLSPRYDPINGIGTDVTFREVAAEIYGDSLTELSYDPAPNTTLPNASTVAAPTGLTLSSGTAELYIRNDGTVFSRLKAEWTAAADVFVSGGGRYQVEYKKTADSIWQILPVLSSSQTFIHILDVQDGVSYDVRVKALNLVGGQSAYNTVTGHTVLGKSLPPTAVSSISATLVDFGIIITWAEISDLDLRDYEVRVGSTWASATQIFKGKGNTYKWEHKTAGSYTFLIKATDTSGNQQTTETASSSLTVLAPSTPTVSSTIDAANLKLSWTAATASSAIKEYEIRSGASYAGGTLEAIVTGLNFTARINWLGSKTYWVAARDIASNTGTAGATSIVIDAPNPIQNLEVTTVDNNVLLDWEDPAVGDLPIAEYKIYKGASFAGASLVGTVYGTFHTYIEKVGGEYTYWVVAIDTAGNVSTEESYTATVTPPSDYILRSSLELINNTDTEAVITERLKYARRISGTVFALSHLTPTMYLDGGREVTTVSGKVSAWADLQNSNDASQGTDSRRPMYTESTNDSNIAAHSEDFTQSEWVKGRSAIAASNTMATLDPIGTNTAEKLVDSVDVGTHRIYQICAAPVGSYTVAIFVKAAEFSKVRLALTNSVETARARVDLDLLTGVISNITGTASVLDWGDGWFLLTVTGSLIAGDTAATLFLYLDNGTGISYGAGTGTNGVYIWGGQVYPASASGNYLQTSAIRRWPGMNGHKGLFFDGVEDRLTTSIAANPSGGMAGGVVVKLTLLTAGAQHFFSAYTGTGANRRFQFQISSTGVIAVYIYNGTGVYIGRTTAAGALAANEAAIITWTYDGTTSATGIEIFKNGVKIDTTSSTGGSYTVPGAGATIEIGSDNNSGVYLNGYIYELFFINAGTLSAADHKLEVARLRDKYLEIDTEAAPDKIMLPLDLETWDEWWTEEGWTTWNDAITAYNADFPTPNIKTGFAKWLIDYEAVLPASFISLNWIRELIGDDITLTPTIKTSIDGSSWTTYAGADEVYSAGFRYVEYILDFVGSLGTELVQLSEVKAVISLKTAEETHIISAVSTDSYLGNPGTYLEFDNNYISVNDIQATALNTAAAICVVDFNGVPYPTYCQILVFNTAGTRITSDVSVRIKGALVT